MYLCGLCLVHVVLCDCVFRMQLCDGEMIGKVPILAKSVGEEGVAPVPACTDSRNNRP